VSGFADENDREIFASFSAEEARLLTGLAEQIVELLETRNADEPDAVLERLLPTAYRDDEADAAEFRRLTEDDLVAAKVSNARTMSSVLDIPPGVTTVEVRMDSVAAGAWLRALTDIRLGLAVRLGIERDDEVPVLDDAGEAIYEVYYWLGALQESLVSAVDNLAG
jgi:hypothetical protein